MTEWPTAPSSQRLADACRRLGLEHIAQNAEANHYHDFFSDKDSPTVQLVGHLGGAAEMYPGMRVPILSLRQRVMEGEFDSTDEEARAWAGSDEAKLALKELRMSKLSESQGTDND
jgi:hypothetical protein